MSALLRHPALVPALFSRAMDTDVSTEREVSIRERLSRSAPLLAVVGWAFVLLIDVPLVKAATLLAALVRPD
ncbi:MAG: hypothetical protein ACRYGP_31960 [Janthinobacterium lividum]